MLRTSVLFGLFTLTLACSAARAQSTGSSASVRTVGIHVKGPDGKAITPIYQDADGKPIGAQTFMNATRKGRRFEVAHSYESKEVILRLMPRGAESGESLIATSGPRLGLGEQIPAFHLQTVNGGLVSPMAVAGEPALVDFFFADCVACIEELPALNAYALQHQNMHFLAITFDDARTAEGFVRERHFAWPVAYNGRSLIKRLAITSFPTMLLLDGHGRLLASFAGSVPASSTRSTASSSRASSSRSGASVMKEAQVEWLDHWVNEHLVTH